MLIKTDNQNYTDIANAIREISGSTDQYKPSEMIDALNRYVPEYGVSYDTFDEDGNVLTATTYGYKVTGFAGNTTIQTINFSEDATEIGDCAFTDSGLTSIELPDSITKIGEYAFSSCYNLKSIILSENITDIEQYAFYFCNLVIDSIPNGVTEVKNNVFYYCDRITEFNFHKNIISIDKEAFYGCSELSTVTFEGTPTTISDDAFGRCSSLTTINVPWSEGEVSGAPWGATNATINYNHVVSTEV